MSASLAQRLVQWLVDEEIGWDPDADEVANPKADWPIFLGNMPDNERIPDQAIAVYDTNGLKDGRLMEGPTIRHPGFQIRVRAMDYGVGWQKAQTIEAKLDTLSRVTVQVDGEPYSIKVVSQTGSILVLGQEPEGRRRQGFTINGTATL
jgi:hypothetical protein